MSVFLDFFKNNWGIFLSGCGVAVLGVITRFLISHKFIKKDEYNKLLEMKHRYETAERLMDGLSFNQEFGIYINNETGEKFCPNCLTDKGKRNHLEEVPTNFGITYRCNICPQTYKDKSYYQRQKDNNDKYLNAINEFTKF